MVSLIRQRNRDAQTSNFPLKVTTINIVATFPLFIRSYPNRSKEFGGNHFKASTIIL